VLTVNGRVRLKRIRWQAAGTPIDRWLDAAETTISQGVRELACRLNVNGRSFAKTAANLKRAAQLSLSGETLRQVVEQEGRRALAVSPQATWMPAQASLRNRARP
jgi:hypothetical protein